MAMMRIKAEPTSREQRDPRRSSWQRVCERRAVHVLRTPTDAMVLRDLTYTPGDGSNKTVMERVASNKAGGPDALRRHPPQPGVLKQMVEPFHQILRDFFDETVNKDHVETPLDFVGELEPLLAKLLWDGQLDTEVTEFTKEDEGAAEVARLLGMEMKDSWTLDEMKDAAEERRDEIVGRLRAAAQELN